MGLLPFEGKERKILEKTKFNTDKKFGKRPEERTIKELLHYGIVNIDKPEGPTSHQVSAYARDILGLKKAGHSGTLDPKVTGSLVVSLGNATRISQALLTAGKEYVCLMRIHADVEEERIRQVMNTFVGKIKQMPPKKSAVKRQNRFRRVYYIDIHEIKGRFVLFTTGTQAGTYIRKLCHDIGEALGVGANMQELRRTKVGPFNESSIVTLQDLTDAYHFYKKGDETMLRKVLLPVEKAVEHLPKIWVMDSAVETLCHGATLKVPGIVKLHEGIEPDMKVAIMSLKDELVMIGNARMNSQKMFSENRGIAAAPDQVFMKPGTYPKIEKI